jgi:lipoprotein-releasing system ATP-binding protein
LTRFRRQNVGFIFQFYNLLPALSALENVALPLLAHGQDWRLARKRSAELLEQVGLAARASHKPSELSGGEQQRVAIARALVARPALVLADEPTGDLDSANTHSILELMVALNRSLGVTFVLASHNTGLATHASQTYEMRDGLLNAQVAGG